MSKKMDDARRASRERDLTSRTDEPLTPFESQLRRTKGKFPLCPECRDSLAILTWNPRTELWEHVRCGYTATQQELDEGLA